MKTHERPERNQKKTNRQTADEKSVRPSSSIGYYDFSPDFPGEQRPDGTYYHTDAPRRSSPRQRWLTAGAAVLVFCAAFLVCRVMLHISEKQPGSVGNAPAWELESTVPPPEIVTGALADG